MGVLNLVLLLAGIALIVVGTARARTPYRRYMALKEQDANIARYEAWRGGVRSDGKSGASVAMDVLRRQAQIGAGIAIAGAVLVVAAAVYALTAVWRWDRTHVVVTEDQLSVVHGIVRRRAAAVRLAKVSTVELDESLLGRLLGYGTLVAGDLEIPCVPRAREVSALVQRLAG